MNRCETQLDILRRDVESYIWTFRWLWLLNLSAVGYGLVARRYDIVALAAVSALVAIIGVARTRRGRRLIERAAIVCILPKQDQQPDADQGRM